MRRERGVSPVNLNNMAEGFSPSKSVDGDSRDRHSHQFKVRFNPSDTEEYTIHYRQPRTVLEAIKSSKKYNDLKCADENIIIQLSRSDKECAVPTHFPCSCIDDGELLIISCESEKVEEAQNKPETVHPRHKYSVFYVESVGGKNTKTKKLFRSKKIKKFKYVCVYGEKEMTLEEALKRDGRFIDDLSDFTLSDSENPEKLTGCKQMVNSLDGKKFKLCLPRKNKRKENDEKLQEKPCASNSSQHQNDSVSVIDVTQQRGTSVKTLVDNSNSKVNTKEINKILRQQFPDLKKLMTHRFPGKSYQKAVKLSKEDFGKIQQSFSEVHRVKKLMKLSESVCLLKIDCFSVTTQGTGFVLFDNFILTNAHLFKEVSKLRKDNWKEYVKVTAVFNYENPDLESNSQSFNVKDFFVDLGDTKLDYALLKLDLEGHTANQTTETVQLPAGLLKTFGPVPEDGEACIIGHPKGEVKQMDPTCIIEKKNRGKAIKDHLEQNRNTCFTVQSISQAITNQGIENIQVGGNQADNVVTYNTFMYHGSSGSPVFDAHCRVFGLHTAGFVHDSENHTKSVIEFAQPLLSIFERLVTKIKESRDEELLKRFEEEAKGNWHLEKSLKSLEPNVPEDSDEPMDTD